MKEGNVSKEEIQKEIKRLLDEIKEKSIMRDAYEKQRDELVKEIDKLLKKVNDLTEKLKEMNGMT